MATIWGNVERSRKEAVGFKCSLCKQSFRLRYDIKTYKTDFDRVEDVSEWPVTNRASLSYDHPDGEGPAYADFCRGCYYKIRDVVKEMGVKIENDG